MIPTSDFATDVAANVALMSWIGLAVVAMAPLIILLPRRFHMPVAIGLSIAGGAAVSGMMFW